MIMFFSLSLPFSLLSNLKKKREGNSYKSVLETEMIPYCISRSAVAKIMKYLTVILIRE